MPQSAIPALLDRLEDAAASDRNQARGQTRPTIGVNMEDPIVWTVLYGFDARRYFTDPAFYLEQNLRQKLWRFENIDDDTRLTLDVPAWLGHYPEYTFFGMDVSVNPRGVPRLQKDHPMTRNPDLSLLGPVDFKTSGWMPRAFRWYEDLQRLADGRISIGFVTWNRGCLDLAIQLRGYDNFIIDTVERPAFIHDLMRFLVEQRNAWHTACAAHFGTQVGPTWVADDWIYVPYISPAIFADFCLPRYLDIERHHGVLGGLHSCGNQAPIQKYMLEIKSLMGFEVSAWTDLTQTLVNLPPDKPLGISLHPNDVLVAAPDEMERKLRFIGESCDGRPYSVGTSGLTPIFEGNQEAEFLRRINQWLEVAHRVFPR